MKKVLLRYYDRANLGDDLFLDILLSRYEDYFIVPSANKDRFTKHTNIIWWGGSVALFTNRIIGKLLHKANYSLRLASRQCDVIVYVGGSVFIDNGNSTQWSLETEFYHDLTRPYYILGSNIGPIRSEQFLETVREILKGAQDVCLRDLASYELTKDLQNVRVATDIAFTLNTADYTIINKKIAIFSLIDGESKFDNITTEQYEASVRVMTERLIANGYRVIYMSFCKTEGDEIANKRILGGLPAHIGPIVEQFRYDGNLEKAMALIASSELIIASRFHATILGLVFGKKVLPMAYSDKTTDILADMAFPGIVVDIRKINQFDPITFDFNNIPIMDIAEQRVLAETQFQELDKVLIKRIADA